MDLNAEPIPVAAGADRSTYFLPALPDLTGMLAGLPAWPVGKLDPDPLGDPIEKRLDAVLNQLRTDNLSGLLSDTVGPMVALGASKLLASKVVADLKSELSRANL